MSIFVRGRTRNERGEATGYPFARREVHEALERPMIVATVCRTCILYTVKR